MPVRVKMDFTDFHQFREQFSEAYSDQAITEVLQEAGEAVGEHLVRLARKTYPPPQRKGGQIGMFGHRSGSPTAGTSPPSPLRTPRQKRWWWWAMHQKAQGTAPPDLLPGWEAVYKTIAGRKTLVLSGSYARTGGMEEALGYNVTVRPGEVTVDVGPPGDHQYASFVIGRREDQQARWHQDWWVPLESVMLRNLDVLVGRFIQAVYTGVARRGQFPD